MTTEVTATDNGSFQISGDFVVKDAKGNTYPTEPGQDVWLCRCGHSANKPFCDGSHKREGFEAVERAVVAGDAEAPVAGDAEAPVAGDAEAPVAGDQAAPTDG